MGSLLDLSSPATVVGQPQVVHTYDNTNRLTTIAQSTSTVTIAYDDADRRTSVTYPNTKKVEYAYNATSCCERSSSCASFALRNVTNRCEAIQILASRCRPPL